MFAPRWPKNTSGRLPRTPPDPYFPAGKLVFAQQTLVFQRSSVLAARSLSGSFLEATLATSGPLLKHLGLKLAPLLPGHFALLPCVWAPLGFVLAHFGFNLAYLNVNFALQEPCLLPSGPKILPQVSRGPLRTSIFLQEHWFSFRKR